MNPVIEVDKLVQVVATFDHEGGRLKCYPRKMRLDGQDIVFKTLSFRHPTNKGQRMLHVIDMSDGANDYRLEFDAVSLQWRLVSMIPGDK